MNYFTRKYYPSVEFLTSEQIHKIVRKERARDHYKNERFKMLSQMHRTLRYFGKQMKTLEDKLDYAENL